MSEFQGHFESTRLLGDRLLGEMAVPYWKALKNQTITLRPYFPSSSTIRRAEKLVENDSTSLDNIRKAAAKLLDKFTILPTQNGAQEAVFWKGQSSLVHNSQLYLSAEGEIVYFSEEPEAKAEPFTRDSVIIVFKEQFLIPGHYPAEFVGSIWRKLALTVNSK